MAADDLCVGVIACMTWITVAASLDRSVLQAGSDLWPDLWFRATLMDAYFGFLTFFALGRLQGTNLDRPRDLGSWRSCCSATSPCRDTCFGSCRRSIVSRGRHCCFAVNPPLDSL